MSGFVEHIWKQKYTTQSSNKYFFEIKNQNIQIFKFKFILYYKWIFVNLLIIHSEFFISLIYFLFFLLPVTCLTTPCIYNFGWFYSQRCSFLFVLVIWNSIMFLFSSLLYIRLIFQLLFQIVTFFDCVIVIIIIIIFLLLLFCGIFFSFFFL